MFSRFQEIKETRVTERSIYLLIHKNGPISKREIADRLGGSISNVNRFVSALEDAGMVSGGGGSGRRAGTYRVNPSSAYAIAGYINPDVVGMGLCDVAGNIVESRETLFSNVAKPEQAVDFLADSFHDLNRVLSGQRSLGTAIAVTGPLNHDRSVVIAPPYLPGWKNVPLQTMLSERLGTPVSLDLFAETVLMGELLYGAHDLREHIGLLWLDKGVGASEFNNGIMNLDKQERSTVVGHQVVNFNGPPCVCGKRGCLETYGSIPTLFDNLKRFIEADDLYREGQERLFARDPWHVSPDLDVIEHALEKTGHNQQIMYVFDEFDKAYTAALGNVINALRLDKLIFSGRLAVQCRSRFERIIEDVVSVSESFTRSDIKVEWIDLDAQKTIRGGAAVVFNQYIQFAV